LKTLLVQKGEDPNFIVTYVGIKMAPVKKEIKVKKVKAVKEENSEVKKISKPKK
jgi:hypothetical protein